MFPETPKKIRHQPLNAEFCADCPQPLSQGWVPRDHFLFEQILGWILINTTVLVGKSVFFRLKNCPSTRESHDGNTQDNQQNETSTTIKRKRPENSAPSWTPSVIPYPRSALSTNTGLVQVGQALAEVSFVQNSQLCTRLRTTYVILLKYPSKIEQ